MFVKHTPKYNKRINESRISLRQYMSKNTIVYKMYINSKCTREYKLDDSLSCDLYYDKTTNRIGIVFSEDGKRSVMLQRAPGYDGVGFNCANFLKSNNIDLSPRYFKGIEFKDGMLIFSAQ